MSKKIFLFFVFFIFSSVLYSLVAQTIVIRGKLTVINSTTGKCGGRKYSCGFASLGPVKSVQELDGAGDDSYMERSSGYYYFPKDYTGEYPENVKTDENGLKYVEKATFIKTINAQKEEEVTIQF